MRCPFEQRESVEEKNVEVLFDDLLRFISQYVVTALQII